MLVIRYLAEQLRETLPDSEETAGIWLAGFVWAFCLHWVIFCAVTLGHCWAKGGC
jgi:uncharacterized membrane protein required for colicin V production